MKTLVNLLNFLPLVTSAVKSIEANMPNTPGATKKEIIMQVIQIACKVGESIPNPTIEGISLLIDSTVNILNKSGIFTHSTTGDANAQQKTA